MGNNEFTDYYNILGVHQTASNEEIKKAFRSKAKHKHPDSGGLENEFILLKQAYDTLTDQSKRIEYDKEFNTYRETYRKNDSNSNINNVIVSSGSDNAPSKKFQMINLVKYVGAFSVLIGIVVMFFAFLNNAITSKAHVLSSVEQKQWIENDKILKTEPQPTADKIEGKQSENNVPKKESQTSAVNESKEPKLDAQSSKPQIEGKIEGNPSKNNIPQKEPQTSAVNEGKEPKLEAQSSKPPIQTTEPKPSKAETKNEVTTVETRAQEDTIQRGTSKETVKAIMGTPTRILDVGPIATWYYGRSTVTFTNDRVTGWDNSGGNLKLVQASTESGGSLSTGSTTNDVKAIMGTPTRILDVGPIATWYYGRSTVTFTNDRVTGWDNSGGNLKLEQTSTESGGTFSTGSTTKDVKAIMGTPTRILDVGPIATWYYGRSTISFTNDKVSGWDNSGNNLKLRH
ncbi:DnaJ domain-containing protein [Paenibacillus filicis]|uniref:DnaJ domain-containing protein n=1 Tax=Paenibacillus gyeongsangnamensis TaxID=3388067 RepID=A0ABT4QBW4_9BACL|nr:J domain-containing protein [Paenibacillus filicis]MCZ8514351.1 DnaJ domain-containing protein [Paenibacillus filicis]